MSQCRSYSRGYQVLSPRPYRLIVTIILQGHPGSSGALLRLSSLLTAERAVPRTTHVGVSPHLLSDKEIYLLRDYRSTFGLIVAGSLFPEVATVLPIGLPYMVARNVECGIVCCFWFGRACPLPLADYLTTVGKSSVHQLVRQATYRL